MTNVPDYLVEFWNLNLDHRPNEYAPLIIPLIRITIQYQQGLNSSQHYQILRKLATIVSSPNVTVFVRLEVVHYIRHVAIKYFTVEYQNECLKLIRQIFNKSFVDSDPIVKKTAFLSYAKVMGRLQHENIHPDHITDDPNVKIELVGFINKQTNLTTTRDEQMKFLHELNSHHFQQNFAGRTMVSSNIMVSSDENDSNEIKRMGEIIKQLRSDTKELTELNRKINLSEEFCKDIASIRQELALLK